MSNTGFALPVRPGFRKIDLLIFAGVLASLYALVTLARHWLGPFTPQVHIDRSPAALPLYAAYSLLRVLIAYLLSLVFAITYGYVAAHNPKAERLLIPLLDVLQSIPVLSFLPGVILAMVALLPRRQLGLELGAILLIFTGQVWNMAFSFYTSLKGIPTEMIEAAKVYRFNAWQRLTKIELPAAVIGLVWNSMMSVAGGWFFLMACEMFVLGTNDFRLPGLGSYLQTAADAGDTASTLWGVGTMVAVIVLLDQILWRPVIAWAEKFKLEQTEGSNAPKSWFLEIVRHSHAFALMRRRALAPLSEQLTRRLARRPHEGARPLASPILRIWGLRVLGIAMLLLIGYGFIRAAEMLAGLDRTELREVAVGVGATFLRVWAALLLALAWTVPAGVAIGLAPRISRVAQPLAQIAASVPATALFPIILLALIRHGGMSVASLILLLLGTQWYVLFNVIAGAMAIPTDLKEASTVFRLTRFERWKQLTLPAIFPYLITGLVTASGGAWNASIVAEYFHFKGQTLSTLGLGATISRATDSGNFDLLLASTLAMSAVVVTTNRLVWRRLYALAHTRFKLET